MFINAKTCALEIFECLQQIHQQVFLLPTAHHNVIHVPPDLIIEDLLLEQREGFAIRRESG
jgi:hypothetical protein